MNWFVVTLMLLFVLLPFLPLAYSLVYTWMTAPEAQSSEKE
ncbi:MAG: hypothetical protein NZ699_00090 [Roseiflexus sp.]|nr:hypothetical protein [Roseiflexus sp.]MCS7287507.1 hypothetical protein [Roseiflexus sp.]MDW8146190.1 hypothetical protein [Roseiflexaceae bacterium]MDW8231363.1 hypothetical protein [Roseiflexaceae bacterium]